jgi:Tfp pilus assembly protein PilN
VRAVNLVPVDQRSGSGPAAGRSEGGAYAVLVLLAGFAGMALLYGTARHEISSRRVKAAALVTQTQQAQAMAAQLAPYTSFLAMREQRVQAVSELAQSRFDWAYAFHELGRVLPKDASITSLSGTVGSVGPSSSSSSSSSSAASSATVTSATPPGSVPVFTLSGCATSQAEVAQTLNRLRLMDGVSSVTLQSSTKPSAGAGAGSSGGCVGTDPTFNVTIDFDPLPAATTTSATTATPAVIATPAAQTGAAG